MTLSRSRGKKRSISFQNTGKFDWISSHIRFFGCYSEIWQEPEAWRRKSSWKGHTSSPARPLSCPYEFSAAQPLHIRTCVSPTLSNRLFFFSLPCHIFTYLHFCSLLYFVPNTPSWIIVLLRCDSRRPSSDHDSKISFVSLL